MTIDYENDGKINFAVNKSVANAKALNSGSIQANGGLVGCIFAGKLRCIRVVALEMLRWMPLPC